MEYITSSKNPVLAHIKKLGTNSSYRLHNREFVCEGLKLLEDAINSDVEIPTVITSSYVPIPLPVDTRVYTVKQSLIKSVSALKSAQDIIFVCKFPEYKEINRNEGIHILLEGMQDPSNVGAIIRSANALGMSSVILTGGCADPFNPKSIRASMGAIFRQHIVSMQLEDLETLKQRGITFYASVVRDGSCDFSTIYLNGSIIAIGNEGHGLSESLMDICENSIMIPINSNSESLNAAVAAAIIMWEASPFNRT